MNKRLMGKYTLLTGVLMIVVGAVLALFPSVSVADPPVQREPFSDTACLSCHTDEQRLKQLTEDSQADEPEEESLSSGPG